MSECFNADDVRRYASDDIIKYLKTKRSKKELDEKFKTEYERLKKCQDKIIKIIKDFSYKSFQFLNNKDLEDIKGIAILVKCYENGKIFIYNGHQLIVSLSINCNDYVFTQNQYPYFYPSDNRGNILSCILVAEFAKLFIEDKKLIASDLKELLQKNLINCGNIQMILHKM